jgi:hypothetical protein
MWSDRLCRPQRAPAAVGKRESLPPCRRRRCHPQVQHGVDAANPPHAQNGTQHHQCDTRSGSDLVLPTTTPVRIQPFLVRLRCCVRRHQPTRPAPRELNQTAAFEPRSVAGLRVAQIQAAIVSLAVRDFSCVTKIASLMGEVGNEVAHVVFRLALKQLARKENSELCFVREAVSPE